MMSDAFKAVQVTEKVWWVGAIDWNIRDFHGYMTGRGTSWNAYIVMGDEPILIDAVKKDGLDEMKARIGSVIDPESIQHIVSNHTEMDHSGTLPELVEWLKPKTLFASRNGAKALPMHFDVGMDITAVEDLGSVNLGGSELTFIETRMVHWPDNMFTYYANDGVLFSSDGFGMHLASAERFTDEINPTEIHHESAKYFANILLPFTPQLARVLEKVEGLNLPGQVIASDHGPIWRGGLDRIVGQYSKWCEQEPTTKAVIVFDSMWDSTKAMAASIADGVYGAGAHPHVTSARATHRSDIMTEVLDAGALLVGSCTLNNNIFPSIADLMTYMKGLRPRNLIGAAFGSYGWSGEAVKQLNAILEAMKVDVVHEGIRVKWVPTQEDLAQCRELGEMVGKMLVDTCDGA